MKIDDVIDSLYFPSAITEAQGEEMRVALVRVRAALTTLATNVHYSARDKTGEDSTRRVQTIAAKALRGEQ